MAQLNDLIVTGAARFVNKIQGTVDKATCDGDGANIASTYMKKGVDYVTAGRKTNTTAGTKSTAEGENTTSSASCTHAEGSATAASGSYSHAEGYDTISSNTASHSEGRYTTASGVASHAEGGGSSSGTYYRNRAIGDYSHVEGYCTLSQANYGHAEGEYTTSNGEAAHAEGYYTASTGKGSHSEGGGADSTHKTSASGNYSHAEGYMTMASHEASHSEGYYTKTGLAYQHVSGKYNVGKSTTAMEIGWGTATDARKNILEVDTTGNIRTPYAVALEASASKLIMIKIGRVVICNFYGFPCSSYSQASVGALELIDSAHAEYRPMYGQCGLGLIYTNENANYVCTIDMLADGKMFVRYKGAVNTRSAGIANTYGMYANLCWITSS